jgi:Fe-Mn family superoxide dismutase
MFILPDLPYASNSLEPVMSDVQLRTHHDKHHATYVKNVNAILEGQSPASLEDVVRQAAETQNRKLFNNSAQAWNHGFFWECMTANGGGAPSGALAEAIQSSFGGLEQLKTRFVEEGATHFASGWAWLVANGQDLSVISTHDADSALIREGTPVLVCDVWEHAYYLDYKQDRKSFLEQWFDKLANWRFAERQFGAANGSGGGYQYPAPS